MCAQNLLLSCIYIYRCSMVQLCSRLTTAHKMALLLLLLVLPLAALAGDIGQELKDLGRYSTYTSLKIMHFKMSFFLFSQHKMAGLGTRQLF